MDVRGYVESNAREFIDDLKQWLAIPSISADPDRHGDVRRSAEWLAGSSARRRFPGRRGVGNPVRRAARGVRRMAGRGPGRPHRPGLRPPRRPAGRAAGGVAQPAVRARRARRPAAGPRRLRRQGAGAVPLPRRARRLAWPRATGHRGGGRGGARRSPSSCWSRARRSRARSTSPTCSGASGRGWPAT